ncbi:MAG: exo-alpha-sialidase, partial [Solirubrobacterales bacterium]|nr:exo-alpha-sialidase [Solirubrobacterales bacterium]
MDLRRRTLPRSGWPVVAIGLIALVSLLMLVLVSDGRAQVASLPDIAVSPNEPAAFQQPSVAVDPTNPARLAIAFQEGRGHESCRVARSQDGGRTWRTEAVVGRGAQIALPGELPQCYDPHVAYGPDGTLYYQYEPLEPGHRRVLVTAARGGGDFEQPVNVEPAGPGTDYTDLYSSRAVDPSTGRYYAAWLRYCLPDVPEPRGVANCLPNPGMLLVAASADGGRTFLPPARVNPVTIPDPARNFVAVDRAGKVYVAWNDGFFTSTGTGNPNPTVLYTSTSGDQGRSFDPPRRLAELQTCSGELCYPPESANFPWFHAAGGLPGQAFVTWWDRPGGRYRVFFAATRDGGQTWSAPRVVGVPPGGDDHQQHRPRVAVTPQGRVYIAYYDLAPDSLQDVYLIESSDAGATFSTPRKLNDVPSDARIGPVGSDRLANFGVRLGLGTAGESPLAAWTDSRRGDRVTGRQDVVVDGPAGAGPDRCVPTRGFRSVRVTPRGRGLRIAFSRLVRRKVDIDVFQQSAGRRILGNRRVARYRGRSGAVTWSGGGAGDGVFVVRLRMRLPGGAQDVRRVALSRRGGRFSVRRAYYRRASCGLVTSFKLE